jgi:hypothetical protein
MILMNAVVLTLAQVPPPLPPLPPQMMPLAPPPSAQIEGDTRSTGAQAPQRPPAEGSVGTLRNQQVFGVRSYNHPTSGAYSAFRIGLDTGSDWVLIIEDERFSSLRDSLKSLLFMAAGVRRSGGELSVTIMYRVQGGQKVVIGVTL